MELRAEVAAAGSARHGRTATPPPAWRAIGGRVRSLTYAGVGEDGRSASFSVRAAGLLPLGRNPAAPGPLCEPLRHWLACFLSGAGTLRRYRPRARALHTPRTAPRTPITSGVLTALVVPTTVGLLALVLGAPVSAEENTPAIGPGYSTDRAAVACVQRALAVAPGATGYGTYGPATTAAVRAFQHAHSITPATGIVGARTGDALERAARVPAECAGRLPTTSPTSPAAARPTLPISARLARQVLENPRVNLDGEQVRPDLEHTAAGQPGSAGVPVSATVLGLILRLAADHSVRVTALETGGHGHRPESAHYTGDAVDLGSLDGHRLRGRDPYSQSALVAVTAELPPGSAIGQSTCQPPATEQAFAQTLPAGITTFPDSCDHLHIQVPVRSP